MNYEALYRGMQKRADLHNDITGAAITGAVPYIGGLVNAGGSIMGLANTPADGKSIKEVEKTPGLSYIPGVGAYRYTRRAVTDAVENKSDSPRKTVASEQLGPGTSIAAATLLGTLLGAGVAREDKGLGAAVGAGVGLATSSAATILGAIIGNARRKRNKQESAEYEKNPSILANYLLPGAATYNIARRRKNMAQRDYAVADTLA